MSASLRLMCSHPAHLLGLGFGTGLSPVMPGTVGTLLAFPIYAGLSIWVHPLGILALCALLYGIGIWACQRTAIAVGMQDPGSIVWDEIVAFLIVLCFVPSDWRWQVGAFAAFRFFDIVKPPPIRHFERSVKGGNGVMLDDLLAAGYALLLLAIVKSVLR